MGSRWLLLLSGIVSCLLFVATLPLHAQPPTQAGTPLIMLQRVTFDPLENLPAPAIAPETGVRSAGSFSYYLVQFQGPIQKEWKARTEELGAVLLDYIPDFAFVARMDGATQVKVRALPFVRWIGPYRPAYKLSPGLDVWGDNKVPVVIQTFPGDNISTLGAQLTSLEGEVLAAWQGEPGGYVRAVVPRAALEQIAGLPAVEWIAPYYDPQLTNNVACDTIMEVMPVWEDLGIYGKGQVVAVADTGLDTGSLNTLSADFRGRVLRAYGLGWEGVWRDRHGHGTHVAGSILGSGVLSGSHPAEHQYAGSFAGVAPEAQLIVQSVMDQEGTLGGIPEDLNHLFGPPYEDGARIHSDSWGTDGKGEYSFRSQMADQFAWTHKDMSLIFAAGNGGQDVFPPFGVIDPDAISSPGTAKNVITVGATESQRKTDVLWARWTYIYYVYPLINDLISDNPNGMAAFSSRGPTDDGRIKPDLVAPGVNIISARSHDPEAGVGWGAIDEHYSLGGGTSMSTPLVAGASALVREFYVEQKGLSNPSAVLIKATLVNGAVNIAPGQYGTGETQEIPWEVPNNVIGWGRVNVKNSLMPASPRRIEFDDHTAGLETGESAVYAYTIAAAPDDPAALRVTLGWTDYPGALPAARALVNDLDLEVVGPDGAHYYGNGGSSPDRLNNVEDVVIENVPAGVYQVIVRAYNAPYGPQPYALVVSGNSLLPSGVPTPTVTPTGTPSPVPTPRPFGGSRNYLPLLQVYYGQ
jgi:subtilisin family serine protease